MFEIKLDKQPEDFLRKCEKILFDRITEKLNNIKENPIPQDVKRIQGYGVPIFRIRIGSWRVLYRINYEEKIIIIVKIDHRDRVY